MNKNTVATIVVVLVVGAGAFYGGMKYEAKKVPSLQNLQSMTQQQRQQLFQQMGAGGRGNRGGGQNGGFVSGQIISKDDTSVTVQLPNNGGSKNVFYSSSTQISKSVSGQPADLSVGQQVLINGSVNGDGSTVTAQNIQIRPEGAMRPQGQP